MLEKLRLEVANWEDINHEWPDILVVHHTTWNELELEMHKDDYLKYKNPFAEEILIYGARLSVYQVFNIEEGKFKLSLTSIKKRT